MMAKKILSFPLESAIYQPLKLKAKPRNLNGVTHGPLFRWRRKGRFSTGVVLSAASAIDHKRTNCRFKVIVFFIWVFLWTLRGSRFKVFVFFFVIWVYYSLLQMAPTSKSKLQICHFSLFLSLLFIFVFTICICPHLLLLLHTLKSRRFFSPCLSNIGQQSLSHLGIVLILRKNLKRDSRCLSASTSRSTVPHATQS